MVIAEKKKEQERLEKQKKTELEKARRKELEELAKSVKENADIESIETEPQEVIAYDLLGRKTKNPTRGIYIINGRKVLIE